MNKYVCFDIGDVLCRVNFDPFLDAISREANITKANAWLFLGQTQKAHDIGLSTIRDELHDRLHIESEVIMNELLTLWDQAVIPETMMLQLLDELNSNDIKLAILSNIGPEHANYLDQNLASCKGYREAIHHFSYQIGARKPSMLYYQSLLIQHPKFKGALFIDDLQVNLDAAKELSFRTVRHSLWDLVDKNQEKTKLNIKNAVQQLRSLILDK